MPSKRTNDSVERILEELSHQQARDGVRDSVNERKVDEILQSVGIDTAMPGASQPALGPIGKEDLPQVEVSGGVATDRFSTTILDDLLKDLPSMKLLKKKTPAASARRETPAPRQGGAAAPIRTPASRPQPQAQVRSEPQPQPQSRPQPQAQVRSEPQPQPQPRPEEQHGTTRAGDSTVGDTTRTSIIKNFLLKMAPGGSQADSQALNQGKEQFQQFFGKTAAVLPDEDGKLRDPSRRKRGLFGLSKAEDSGQFVPINVSLSTRREDPPAQPQPEVEPEWEEPAVTAEPSVEMYTPDADDADDGEAQGLAPAAPVLKRGMFGELFGAPQKDTVGDMIVPEARAHTLESEPMPEPEPEPEPEPRPEPETPRTVYHSAAHAEPAADHPSSATGPLTGLRDALRGGATGATGTIYRKKRNTIEFTPGQKLARRAESAPRAKEPVGEPVGEPIMTSTDAVAGGYTPAASVDTQNFLRELTSSPAVRRATASAAAGVAGAMGTRLAQSAPAPQPVPAPAPRPAAPTSAPAAARTRPAQPAPAAPAQPAPAAPAAPASVQSAPARPAAEPAGKDRGDTFEEITRDEAATMTGEVRLADIAAGRGPATTGFSAKLDLSAQEGISADTADFVAQLDAEPRPRPDTGAFVRGIEKSINEEEEDLPDDDRFAQAAGILTDTTGEVEAPARPKRTGGVRLTGDAEDEAPAAEENQAAPFEEDAPAPAHRRREYEHPEDAPAVRRDLDKQILLLTVAVIVGAAVGAVLLYLGVAATGALPMPAPLDPAAGATPLLAAGLVLLGVVCALCWRTMALGLLGVVKSPTADTLPALAALGALVQLGALLIKPDWYDPQAMCLMAGPAALLLCFNALGKRLDAVTARENFTLVSARVDHAVAYRLKDAGILRAVTKGLDQPQPSVLVNRPTQLMKDFLSASAAHRSSDKNQQQLGRLVGILALAALVFTLAYRKDPGLAFTTMAAVLCLGAPLAGTLLSALPARLMQRSAAQVGAVIPGWRDIRQLGRINVIQVSARDLFPKGCVKLCGIKPVHKERIDMAIIYAASMFAAGAPTLRDVFLGMIGDNRKLLNKVDDFETVYGKGYVGWINGERVLAGNRALMDQFGIEVPSLQYEQRHTVNQRRVIYLAVSGKLFSMFQVAYQADPDTGMVLDSLRRTGMSLIVDCDDFNCDEALLETAYALPTGTVRVLDTDARRALEPATAWLPESEGNMLHLGSFASFVGGLEAAAGAAQGERKAAMILSVSVLLSCVLALIMVLAGGIAALPLPALVLYQAAWAVLALIFPLLQRY